MPRRLTQTKAGTHQTLKNMAYESIVVSWLMQDVNFDVNQEDLWSKYPDTSKEHIVLVLGRRG